MTLPHEIPPYGPSAALVDEVTGPLPMIDTARCLLRPPVLADLPAWYAILCSDRARYMDGPYDRDAAYVEFAASVGAWLLHGHGLCTVVDRASGAVLGFVSLNMEPGDREPELGYFFLPEACGRGLATEAVRAMRDWARVQCLPSLVSYIDPANTRSAALAARLGARRDQAAEFAYYGTPDAGVQVWRHIPGGSA